MSLSVDKMMFRPVSFYEENNIEVVYQEAKEIDADAKKVILSDGRVIPYDKCFAATGATASKCNKGGKKKKWWVKLSIAH